MQLIEDRVNSDTIDEFLSDYIAFGENDIKDNDFGLYEKYKNILIEIKKSIDKKKKTFR
jgi:hypothetical protein